MAERRPVSDSIDWRLPGASPQIGIAEALASDFKKAGHLPS
jgi:hypothetical protein